MPSPSDTVARLASLEQILGETTSGTAPVRTTEADAADVHLGSVPVERLRRLTAALQGDPSQPIDEIDGVVMRLLLYEYASAVGHLRAVARLAAATVDGAAEPLRDARRAVHQLAKALAPETASSASDTDRP